MTNALLRLAAVLAALLLLPAAAPVPKADAPKGPPKAAFPNTEDGRPLMQLGLEGWKHTSLEQPFLDLTMLMGNDWAAVGRKSEMTFADLWNEGYIDRKTLLPTAIPPDARFIRSGLFRFGARHYPRHFSGDYVLEWEGDADMRFGFGHQNQRRVGKNRVEAYFHPADTKWCNFEIVRIGEGGLKKVRLYRKEHEDLVNAVRVFDPNFIDYASRYKILRTLDIQSAVITDIRSVDRLKKKGQFGYGSAVTVDKKAPTAPVGAPIEVLFDLAMETGASLWMHAPTLIGAPPIFDQLGIKSEQRDELRPMAKAKAKEILASPEWRRFADEIVRSLVASGYPQDRMLYVELSNEVWNYAHPFWWPTNYFAGIGESFGDHANRFGLGYATANFAVVFEAALKAAGREQAYAIVLAGQMANPATTKGALEGFNRYFVDRSLNAAPYLRRLGVSTASYYHGAFEKNSGVVPIGKGETYESAWLAAIERDPEGLSRRIADFYIKGSDRTVGTIPYLVRMRNEHQRLAEEAGAFFLGDYEGESHETGGGALKKEPLFVNFVEKWRAGPHGERVTKAWAAALYAQNPKAVISNYKGIGVSDPEDDSPSDRTLSSPWDDGFYGEINGRALGLDPYLRPGKGKKK
jgi:hypothetical protein